MSTKLDFSDRARVSRARIAKENRKQERRNNLRYGACMVVITLILLIDWTQLLS